MGNENKIDRLDEIMRMIYLDQIFTMDTDQLQQELSKVQAGNKGSAAPGGKEMLLARLASVMKQPSFGELIQVAMEDQQVADTLLIEKTGLSPVVIGELRNDLVYPNNVPIQLLKKLAVVLKLPYASVKSSVLKTFEVLRQQVALRNANLHVPAYRKGHQALHSSSVLKDQNDDGKELFENEEALNKYLNRLEELMNE